MKREMKRPTVTGQQKPPDAPRHDNILVQTLKSFSDKIDLIEKSLKSKRSQSDDASLQGELKLLKDQFANEMVRLQTENDNLKKDAEIRKVADQQLKEAEHQSRIQERIKVMIAKGAIASGDVDSIKHWTSLYNIDYDTTDYIVSSQLEKLDTGIIDSGGSNTPVPPHESIRDIGDQMASKYLAGDRDVFKPKIK